MTGPVLVGWVGHCGRSHRCLHRVSLTQSRTSVYGALFFPLVMIEFGTVIAGAVYYWTIPGVV